jgi:hypothetical protein
LLLLVQRCCRPAVEFTSLAVITQQQGCALLAKATISSAMEQHDGMMYTCINEAACGWSIGDGLQLPTGVA